MHFLLVTLAAAIAHCAEHHLELAATPLSGADVQELFERAVPGVDFPMHHRIPLTDFNCTGKLGYFADTTGDARCQIIRRCTWPDGAMVSFICPNGTLFNNLYLVCDWWYNVDCSIQDSLANFANENLYKSPKLLLHVEPPSGFIPPWWLPNVDDPQRPMRLPIAMKQSAPLRLTRRSGLPTKVILQPLQPNSIAIQAEKRVEEKPIQDEEPSANRLRLTYEPSKAESLTTAHERVKLDYGTSTTEPLANRIRLNYEPSATESVTTEPEPPRLNVDYRTSTAEPSANRLQLNNEPSATESFKTEPALQRVKLDYGTSTTEPFANRIRLNYEPSATKSLTTEPSANRLRLTYEPSTAESFTTAHERVKLDDGTSTTEPSANLLRLTDEPSTTESFTTEPELLRLNVDYRTSTKPSANRLQLNYEPSATESLVTEPSANRVRLTREPSTAESLTSEPALQRVKLDYGTSTTEPSIEKEDPSTPTSTIRSQISYTKAPSSVFTPKSVLVHASFRRFAGGGGRAEFDGSTFGERSSEQSIDDELMRAISKLSYDFDANGQHINDDKPNKVKRPYRK